MVTPPFAKFRVIGVAGAHATKLPVDAKHHPRSSITVINLPEQTLGSDHTVAE